MKKRFYKDTYRLGYNTREEAENIPFEACQSLVNARPGDPAPTPREGIPTWGLYPDSLTSAMTWSFGFKVRDTGYGAFLKFLIFGLADGGIYYAGEFYPQTEIAPPGTLDPTENFVTVRYKASLFVLGDQGTSIIISYNGNPFTWRTGNIARPPIAISGASAGAGTAIPAGQFVSFAATLVNRASNLGADPLEYDLDNGGFVAGLLESPDDIDTRFIYENTSAVTEDVDLSIEINNVDALNSQATHLRLYATDAQTTEAAAAGAEHKWFADLPLYGANATGAADVPGPGAPYEYTFTFDPGTMAGALDILSVIGYDPIPACKSAIVHGGRLWVGGAGEGDTLGRWYYSEIPLDLEEPIKWLSMFRIATYFKDTAIDNSDIGTGLGISRNDLILVMENSVWSLRDGDPDFEPQLIDANNGSSFPKTFTLIGRDFAYLGNNGPVLIQGREAVAMEDFTAGEVWPLARGNQVGYFHALEDKTVVQGFFLRETFFIADEEKIVGNYMPLSGNGRGPWQVVPAVPDIRVGHVAQFDRDTVVICSRTDGTPTLYEFLRADVRTDAGINNSVGSEILYGVGETYLLRSKSLVYLFDARNSDQAGELFDIFMNAYFTDAGRLDIYVSATYFRFHWQCTYHEVPNTDDEADESIDPSWRNVLRQGFPEGLVGFAFEVEWVKEYADPFDFQLSGFFFRAKPVEGHPAEFLSQDLGSGPVENGPDVEYWLPLDFYTADQEDVGPHGRVHSFQDMGGEAEYHYMPALVPAAGIVIDAFLASSFEAASWSGVTALGTRGLTREFVVRPSALSRPEFLEWAGDGTYFLALRVNVDGSLTLIVYAAAVKRTYTTAAAALPPGGSADTYTVQVTLSADMLTCRFYVAQRTGAYVALPAPTAATLPPGGPHIYEPGCANTYYRDEFATIDLAFWDNLGGTATTDGDKLSGALELLAPLALGAGDTLTVALGVILDGEAFVGGTARNASLTLSFDNGAGDYSVGLFASDVGAPSVIRVVVDKPIGSNDLIDTEFTLDTGEVFTGHLVVEATQDGLAIWLNGAFIAWYEFSAAPASAGLIISAMGHDMSENLSPYIDYAVLAGVEGLPEDGIDLGLVRIPVKHAILPGSSYAMSMARGLRIAKPPIRAQAFHNAMRGKSQ